MVPPRANNQLPVGVTPGKIGVIAVLSLVFVVVIFYQMKGGKEDTQMIRQALERRQTGNDAGKDQALAKLNPTMPTLAAQRPVVRKWQVIPLDEALAHDPFALPPDLQRELKVHQSAELAPGSDAATARTRREELNQRREAAVNAMREQGVGMVLATARGTVAVIGSRQLQVGDIVEGLRVAEIGPAGVRLVETKEP